MFNSRNLAAVLGLVALFSAAPAWADGGLYGAEDGGGDFVSRKGLLAISAGINLAASSAFAYELAAGEKSLALDAASVVLATPTLIYSAVYWSKDRGDWLMAASTAWSAAILVRGAINVVKNSHEVNEPPGIYWTPVAMAGGGGFSLSGGF